jgi:ribosomal protein S27AE
MVAEERMICSRCGEEMRMTEKDTSSGRDIREYECPGCGYTDWEERGPALWKILSDDREEFEAAKAAQASPLSVQDSESPPQLQEPEVKPASSLWRRFLAFYRYLRSTPRTRP